MQRCSNCNRGAVGEGTFSFVFVLEEDPLIFDPPIEWFQWSQE